MILDMTTHDTTVCGSECRLTYTWVLHTDANEQEHLLGCLQSLDGACNAAGPIAVEVHSLPGGIGDRARVINQWLLHINRAQFPSMRMTVQTSRTSTKDAWRYSQRIWVYRCQRHDPRCDSGTDGI